MQQTTAKPNSARVATSPLVVKRIKFMDETRVKSSDDPSNNNIFKTLMVSLDKNNLMIPLNRNKLSSSQIMHHITAKPILARMTTDTNMFFLHVACKSTNLIFLSLDAIKCLIAANPNALLWQSGKDDELPKGDPVITKIAEHMSYCRLMPWIATEYSWIFAHEMCPSRLYISLIKQYLIGSKRQYMGGNTMCTSLVIEQFCKAYPNSLTPRNTDGHSILHEILCVGVDNEHTDLFKRLVRLCPSVVSKRNSQGRTLLHSACSLLAKYGGNVKGEICKFLIKEYPHLVKVSTSRSVLPNLLGLEPVVKHQDGNVIDKHHRQAVMEVFVSLLRVYPEIRCLAKGIVLNSPVQRRMKAYLTEERNELLKNIKHLKEMIGAFSEAQNKISTVWVSWAVSLVQDMADKLKVILKLLIHLEQ